MSDFEADAAVIQILCLLMSDWTSSLFSDKFNQGMEISMKFDDILMENHWISITWASRNQFPLDYENFASDTNKKWWGPCKIAVSPHH